MYNPNYKPRLRDMIGKTYNQLTVLLLAGRNSKGRQLLLCRCSCGKETIKIGTDVKNGKAKNCGCTARKNRIDATRKANTKHGFSVCKDGKRNRLYGVWHGMKERCSAPKCKDYPRYGGKGITVCDEWKDDFLIFHDWAIANGYKDSLTIDRVDNDKGYTPDNCRWVDIATQNRNKGDTIIVEYEGKRIPLIELKDKAVVCMSTLRERIRNGWGLRDALNTPAKGRPTEKGHPREKAVAQFDLHGNLIATFVSTVFAGRALHRRPTGIAMCARGITKTAYGYKWQYV